jgi:integrase
MGTAKITISVVGKLEAGETVWDTDTRGFGVRCQKRDPVYIVKYRAAGRQRLVTIGKHGAPWTPDSARKEAKRVLGAVASNEDPAADRDGQRSSLTLDDLAERYFSRAPERNKKLPKATTLAFYRRLMKNHVSPAIGHHRSSAVNEGDVEKLMSEVTARAGAVTANRMLSLLSAVYAWAGRKKLVRVDANPTTGVGHHEEQGRERYLTPEELGRLGEALREAETVGVPWRADEEGKNAKHLPKVENRLIVISAHEAAAIRLLMLTGCRLREILHLRWSEIDFSRGLLFLPDSKGGRKTVVLASPALAILDELDRKGVYVIPGRNAGKELEPGDVEQPKGDLRNQWAAVAHRAGLNGVRMHDLRHTFASYGAGANLGLPMIGKLLGHKSTQSTARYAHVAVDPQKQAADLVAGQIASFAGRRS